MKAEVDNWYDGYKFRDTTIYNPWSLLNFVDKKGDFELYWISTADNQLIKNLIEKSLDNVKGDLELLLSGNSITKEIDKTTVFIDLKEKPNAIWSLFLFTGYLTYTKYELIEGIFNCDLTIPNKEIFQICCLNFANLNSTKTFNHL